MLNRVNHRAAGRGGSKTKARNRGLQQTPGGQFKAKYQCKRPPGKARGRTAAATATGRRRNLSDSALLGMLLRHGLLSLKVLGAIHWEAAKLWLKGVRIQPRPPPPEHAVTIVSTQRG